MRDRLLLASTESRIAWVTRLEGEETPFEARASTVDSGLGRYLSRRASAVVALSWSKVFFSDIPPMVFAIVTTTRPSTRPALRRSLIATPFVAGSLASQYLEGGTVCADSLSFTD
jgi:hypothetical protein